MKTILIPIDFSALSYSSAYFALELAQQMDAQVVLLHVIPAAAPVPAFNIPVIELTAWKNPLYDQMAEALRHFQGEIRDYQRQHALTSVPLRTRLVIGQPADGILEAADQENAIFIVMSTVGASNAWDKLVGSVTSDVAQRATRPVWILPGVVKLDALRLFSYFADLKGKELQCISQVLHLGKQLRASMELVHVSLSYNEEFSVSEAIIDVFENAYAPERITFQHLIDDTLSEGIEDYVRNYRPDALILAHRNRNFFNQLVHQSQIRHLSLITKRPLLLIQKTD
ncbi:universal stress protein [Spirosoma flavum]|uniref:Universal stress protein n=1 Tax=Spirosoma flavum TaxID=2048557 RepID=A0ABW6AKZ0_9BACT